MPDWTDTAAAERELARYRETGEPENVLAAADSFGDVDREAARLAAALAYRARAKDERAAADAAAARLSPAARAVCAAAGEAFRDELRLRLADLAADGALPTMARACDCRTDLGALRELMLADAADARRFGAAHTIRGALGRYGYDY